VELVVANGQFFNAEICLECVSYSIPSHLCDATVENLKMLQRLVVVNQSCHGERAYISDIAIPKVEELQVFVVLFKRLAE